ncbi:MAG: hypothetical protein AAF417_19405 [Pseudomonadota bacterium]
MLLIELNEFSTEFLKESSADQETPCLDKILGWNRCKTVTDADRERHGLDPWVQWVSIHTGVNSQEHGVAHLAEANKLRHQQIWDCLNERGVSTTVWGAMNGRNNHHRLMNTFFPDPWTYSEVASPNALNGFLALPRLYAQDYIRPSLSKLFGTGFRTVGYLLWHHLGIVSQNAGRWLRAIAKGGLNNAILFALFDNVSAKVFRRIDDKKPADFKLIFLNSIAHLQHHDWHSDSRTVQIAIGLLEDTLATTLRTAKAGEPVLVANAFSQVCTEDRDEFLYRPINPPGMIEALQIRHSRVEPMMTNDGHILFDDSASCEEAFAFLTAVTVGGAKAFDVHRRADTQLFYQFAIWDELPEHSRIEAGDLSLRFYDFFEKVVRRTGSHTPIGDVFYSDFELPSQIYNHELFHHIKGSYVSGT